MTTDQEETRFVRISRNSSLTLGLVLSALGFAIWITWQAGLERNRFELRLGSIQNQLEKLETLVRTGTVDRFMRSDMEQWVERMRTAATQHAHAIGKPEAALLIPDLP